MTALTKDRDTRKRAGDIEDGPVAAGQLIYAGAIVMRDAAGNLIKGATAVGSIAVGRSEERVDNSTGAAGEKSLRYQPGIFDYANSAGADEITAADHGDLCWVVDDQTVAKTNSGASRSKAGIIHRVEGAVVWVRFDEAMTNIAS